MLTPAKTPAKTSAKQASSKTKSKLTSKGKKLVGTAVGVAAAGTTGLGIIAGNQLRSMQDASSKKPKETTYTRRKNVAYVQPV